MAIFLRAVLPVMSGTSCHEWHIARLWMICEVSQAPPAVASFLTFADLVLAAGSAHSWSYETSPVRAHVHSEGRACILTAGSEPRQVPRVGSAETAHQPCPGLASSTSYQDTMSTEHDAATFKISFQNRITAYK